MSLDERIWRFLVDEVALDVCLEVEILEFRARSGRRQDLLLGYLMVAAMDVLYTLLCAHAMQTHRELAVDGMTLEELYDVEPIDVGAADRPVVQQESVFVSCLYCKRQMHASRYTNHLEKCMTGSRREVTPKEQEEAASETERQQLQTLSMPPLVGASDS